MAQGETIGSTEHPKGYGLEQARADLVEAVETAGIEPSDDDPGKLDDLVKVGGGGVSFELRFNGETIPIDGNDVNTLSRDDFQPFLKRVRATLEAGEFDTQIEAAVQKDGPMKALARTRAVDND